MKTNRKRFNQCPAWVTLLLSLAVATAAVGQTVEPPRFKDAGSGEIAVEDQTSLVGRDERIRGQWPKKRPKVSIVATNEPIVNVLQSVAKQLGFGLVINASEASLEKTVTLRLVRQPAKELLEIVLENGNLQAELRGDIIYVKEAPRTVSGVSTEVQVVADTDSDQALITVKHSNQTRHGLKREDRRHRRHNHAEDRIQMGKPLRIEAHETVGDAVVIGGPLTVAGRVHGDAVSVGGPVTVEPTGIVHGEATSVGGTVNVMEGAVVEGGQVGINAPFTALFKGIDSDHESGGFDSSDLTAHFTDPFVGFSILGALLRTVLLFALTLLVMALIPRRVERIRDYLSDRPGFSVLGGFVLLFSFLPLVVLLAITVIGIPLIPLAGVVYLLIIVVGLAVLVSWIGYKIPLFKERKTQLGAVAIGVAVLAGVNLIPIAGPIVTGLACFVTAGATLLSRVGSEVRPAE